MELQGEMMLLLLIIYAITYTSQVLAQEKEFFLKQFEGNQNQATRAPVSDLLEDKRGLIYVANQYGLLEYDGIQWRHINLPHNQPALALGADHNGRVYVAGQANIGYLSPDLTGKMIYKSLIEEVPSHLIPEIKGYLSISYFGEKIAFISENFVLIWDGHHMESIETPFKIYAGIGFKDQLYVSTDTKGFMILKKEGFSPVPGGRNFTASSFITVDSQLNAGTLGRGINEIKWVNDSVTFQGLKNHDPSMFKGFQISHFQIRDSIAFTGTIGGGLNIFDLKHRKRIELSSKTKQALGDDIFAIKADRRGRIWLGTNHGIYVLMDKQPSSSPVGKVASQEFIAYIRSCLSLKDQSTVFGGAFFKEIGGVQTLEASELNKPTLAFAQNSLRFTYSSSDLVNADIIEYQTYLEGFDSQWSDWSERTYREFTNLVWKEYQFHVRARRGDGTISKEARFEFTIDPPWYEQYWFYSLQLFILTIVFLIVVYINGWTDPTQRKDRSKKLNNIIVGTIWGYSFSKIGVQGALWAFSGGAAFLAVISKVVMGIFLKPMQKKVELKIIDSQKNLVKKLQRKQKSKEKRIENKTSSSTL